MLIFFFRIKFLYNKCKEILFSLHPGITFEMVFRVGGRHVYEEYENLRNTSIWYHLHLIGSLSVCFKCFIGLDLLS